MNVTSTQRSITEYALTLSEQDAQGALTDPFSFGERIAEQLRAAGVTPAAEANGHLRPRKADRLQLLRGEHFKKAKPAKAARKANHPNGGNSARSLEQLSCTWPGCGKKIARKYINLHMRKMHSGPAPVPAAE